MFLQRLVYQDRFSGEKVGPLILNPNLNIIFGKSASGKTRTLNILFGIGLMHRGGPVSSTSPETWAVLFKERDKEYFYQVGTGNNEGNLFVKQDALHSGAGETLIFDREQNKLLNEVTNEEERYSPISNELSLNYVKDTEKHKTALKLRNYLTQFKRLDYSIANVVGATSLLDNNRLIVEPNGAFLDATISNIMNGFPTSFEKIKMNFMDIYPHVENISIGKLPVGINSIQTLFIKEDFLDIPYPWFHASSGMVKTLALLSILFSPLEKSLIMIDEIENSLDYEGLVKIADIIKEVSMDRQIVVATHSPIFANMFAFDQWIICTREGKRTKFHNIKKDAKLAELFNQNFDNFSLYTQDFLNLVEQK